MDPETVDLRPQSVHRLGRLHQFLPGGRRLVGIQAGASREDRRWSPDNFARVADLLAAERGAKIVLFGAASEKRLGDQVAAAMTRPAINLIGSTSLGELIGWVQRLDLLITNDTGTMHIAAALDTPIVALFFVHARVEETGPYCRNAIILQAAIDCAPCSHHTVCHHHSCLTYITPEDVIAACGMALDGADTPPDDPSLFSRVTLYRSRFHRDGGVEFVPLRRRPLDKFELFAYLYRPLFLAALPKWDEPERIEPFFDDDALDEITGRFSFSEEPGRTGSWLRRAAQGAGAMIELAGEGERLTGAVATGGEAMGREELAGIASRLEQIDRAIASLGDTHEAVGPLAAVYRRRVENFAGESPPDLARQANMAHHWLRAAAELFASAVTAAGDRIMQEQTSQHPSGIQKG